MGRRVVVLVLGGALMLGAAPGIASAERVAGPEGKLHSEIRRLVADQQQGRPVRPPGQAAGLKVDPGGRVLVDVYVDGEAGQAAGLLRQAGMDVQAATNKAPVHMVEGWLPVAAATRDAALGPVRLSRWWRTGRTAAACNRKGTPPTTARRPARSTPAARSTAAS